MGYKKWLGIVLTMVMLFALVSGITAEGPVWDFENDPYKEWTGQGADNPPCEEPYDENRTPAGWIHWVLTGTSEINAAVIIINGDYSNPYPGYPPPSPVEPMYHFFTPYFDLDDLDAVVYYKGTLMDNAQFTISDYCPGEQLEVSKTAETTFVRTHEWDIDKWVDTEYTIEVDGVIYPKIWLAMDGRGDETATWYVDVTYEGYEDSGFNVSGTITIENTGNLDAVIESVVDKLGGTEITVVWPADFEAGDILGVGETITLTYSEDGYVEGINEVTVTTERAVYTASAAIVWGYPTTEVNKTVTIKDLSDLFSEVELGAVTAPNGATFDYTYDFAYDDYADNSCEGLVFENTAWIVETEQYAEAILKVNIQCHFDESAWAKGDSNVPFCDYFSNWGWTNLIEPGEYEWPLWAGAAQCDTDNGTLVGSVTVVYCDETYEVEVTYNVDAPYILEETHVYAGYDMFPEMRQGRRTVSTVAPGQYYNDGPFDGSKVYVIAHAVVVIPEWPFGPFEGPAIE